MPLPQARIHLDQLVPPVAGIVLQLHLRDAVEPKRTQELQRIRRQLRQPAGLRDPRGPDLTRRLLQLPSGEHPELLAVGREIRADGPQRVVSARDPLLHERTEVPCVVEAALELARRGAAKRLDAEACTERGRVRRLHERREAERVGRLVRGPRHRDADLGRDRELMSLVLDRPEHVPAGKRAGELQHVPRTGDRLEIVVVRREDDAVAERAQELDVRITRTRRRDARLRVT